MNAAPPSTPPTYPSVTGNWQIQTSLGAPTPGPLLQGDLLQTGSSVTGVLRFINLDSGNACSTTFQTAAVQGSVSDSGKLSLTAQLPSSTITIVLQLSTLAHDYNGGTIAIEGGPCAYPSTPALGVNIAVISGGYSGQVSTSGSLQGVYGNVATTITQSQDADANGQYSVTGMIKFAGPLCSISLAVSGALNGDELVLTSAPDQSGNSELTLHAGPDNNSLELLNVSMSFSSGPCSAAIAPYGTYTGTLKRTS